MTNTIRTAGFQALTEALVEGRKNKGMTQRQLATVLRCQPATVANIEAGQRRIDVIELIALAHALDLKPMELFEIVVRETDIKKLEGNFSRL